MLPSDDAVLTDLVAFNVITCPNLFRRVVKGSRARDAYGRSTKLLTVRLYLFIASMVLALLLVIAGVAALAGGFE